MARKEKIVATVSVGGFEIDITELISDMIDEKIANDRQVDRVIQKQLGAAVKKAIDNMDDDVLDKLIKDRVRRAATGTSYL